MHRRSKKTNESQRDSSLAAENLFRRLNQLGYKSVVIPLERLEELSEDIAQRHRNGQFAPELFDERYSIFDFDAKRAASGARSIVIVAALQPYVRLRITNGGRRGSVIIPPTYSIRIDEHVAKALKGIRGLSAYRISDNSLPLKLLAVRSGLARYGRNNLVYVEGMGSYCRLIGFFTSLRTDNSTWIDPQPVEECEKCVACIKKCPTNAISRDRFLIRAERCLTFHNERKTEFPADLLREWHHCLIGCLYCQAYCPINRKVNIWVEEYGTLDEHDTEVLLEGGPPEAFSEAGRGIMDDFEFCEQLSELSRNMKALLSAPANLSNAEKLAPRRSQGKQSYLK